jgi:hypothetical protein
MVIYDPWFASTVLCLMFGFAGLGMEVVFTALYDFVALPLRQNRDRRFLNGYSSVWYLPLYMAVPFIFSLIPDTFFLHVPWYWRAVCYIPAFWIVEMIGMYALRLLLGKSPSEDSYAKAKYNLWRLTRLDYAPAQALLGLFMEACYVLIQRY